MSLPDIVEMSLDYLEKGGEVMIPLIGISFWMWFLIFKKLVELYVYRKDETPAPNHQKELSSGTADLKGWKGRLVEEFLRNCSFDPEADKKLLTVVVKKQLITLEKGVKTILVLASVAPLLGLLGTVTGMITTFDVISIFGTGNAKALAAGISEALITTQTGLIVAIPGLFMGNFLSREVQRFHDRMDRFGLSFYRLFESDPDLARKYVMGVNR